MLDVRLILSGSWIAVMLIYLLGDVLRIFSRDFPTTMDTAQFTQPMWLSIAVLMVTPILMLFLCLVLPQPISRWANIIVAIFWFLFNLVGLPTYPSAYDRFLLIVSMGFNVVTVWYAWNWAA